jgi:signal transduction histidine kinase
VGSGKGWNDEQLGQRIGQSRLEHEVFDGEPEKWKQHRKDLEAHRAYRDFRYKRLTPDGAVQHVRSSGRPFFDVDGRFLGYQGTTTDITVEVEARTQLTDALESMADGVVIFDAEDRLVTCNESYRDVYRGLSDLLVPGTRFEDLIRTSAERGIVRLEAGREDEWVQERLDLFSRGQGLLEVQLTDGRWLQSTDRKTTNGYTVGIRTDITEAKQREEQYRRAQKMEAVGQLTGGIAHDFNNLLAIVQGNIAYLDKKLDADSELKKLTAPALRAVQRGATLTQRLMAFSRSQPLHATVVDAGELIGDLDELLRRSLGEDISIETVIAADLWCCFADPGQLEQAIINLANNSRDAMPNGGRLWIEVSNTTLSELQAAQDPELVPGEYVVIAVTDTGSGIAPEHVKTIFEPFYTTKEVGKGTGLGLSMVYGFIKQSDGQITVYSEPGKGTTFKLYLPRSREKAVADESPISDPIETAREETILVVEDDTDLRRLAVVLLTDLGYRVLEAASGKAAQQLLERETHIDLLLTDVVLPEGMNGKDVADAVLARIPTAKVLYMSGYAENAIAHHGRLDPGVRLMPKPFDPDDLARQARAAIDA